MSKFPQELDTDIELYEVENAVDDILAEHHNVLKEAIKKIEAKLGIDMSEVRTSLDYIVKQLAIKSIPPSGFHKVYEIYGRKTDAKYRPIIIYESEPEP